MKRVYKTRVYFLFFTLFAFAACQNKQETSSTTSGLESSGKAVVITRQQFETAKMELGKPGEYVFYEAVYSKGYLRPSPEGIALVNVPIPGNVKNIRYNTGEWVNQGAVLFELEGKEIIEIQQEYIQENSRFEMAKAEKERLDALQKENIVAVREYQTALSQYQVSKAGRDALKSQLQLLKLDPDLIASGKIASAIPVKAPISGYLTALNIISGEYLERQKNAVELVNNKKLLLYFYVFEKDLPRLKVGQRIAFFEPDRKEEIYDANISVIGHSIDPDSKTIECIANIDQHTPWQLLNGMYTECKIITASDTAMAVPSDAVVKDGFNSFVLVKSTEDETAYSFKKVPVETGREELEYTELLTPGLDNVLLSGLYMLNLEE